MNARRPLVLLHGWGMSPAVWRPLQDALGAEAATLAPALPAHGGPAAAPTLAAWADALAPALPDGAVLCGWSLGALLALDIARRHPKKAHRLVLIGATPRFVAAPDWPHGLAADTVAAFRAGFAADPAATQRRFVALQSLGDAQRKAVQATLTATLAPADAALAGGLDILAETDLRAEVASVSAPTLLLHGAGDALMPIAAARWLAEQLPHARLDSFDACGHAPLLSRAADCAARMRSFADA